MEPEKPKTKKPSNTAFKQQRLKSWQPLLTPKTVIPTFLIIGAIFLPIGIGLLVASNNVKQVIVDYTNCRNEAGASYAPPTTTSYGPITEWKYDRGNKTCSIRFNIDQTMEAPVFLYYRLHNFYQNHRRYVKSFDAGQLRGNIITPAEADKMCKPLGVVNSNTTFLDGTKPNSDAVYYPCGLIANSLFTDDISDLVCYNSNYEFRNGTDPTPIRCVPGSRDKLLYQFNATGIAWPSDKEKYEKSQWASKPDAEIKKSIVPPPKWMETWPDRFGNGYNSTNLPDLKNDERFQVWMRTAGLHTFRKLFGRNDQNSLPYGTWQIDIVDRFEVLQFGGKKAFVVSTVSILGGKNPFLGIAYMVVGIVCLLLGVLFLARHMIKPRKLGDHSHLSWNKEPAANAGTRPY